MLQEETSEQEELFTFFFNRLIWPGQQLLGGEADGRFFERKPWFVCLLNSCCSERSHICRHVVARSSPWRSFPGNTSAHWALSSRAIAALVASVSCDIVNDELRCGHCVLSLLQSSQPPPQPPLPPPSCRFTVRSGPSPFTPMTLFHSFEPANPSSRDILGSPVIVLLERLRRFSFQPETGGVGAAQLPSGSQRAASSAGGASWGKKARRAPTPKQLPGGWGRQNRWEGLEKRNTGVSRVTLDMLNHW